MIESGIFLIIAVALRILMGHLATKFTVLSEWLKWFNVIAIAAAVVLGVMIVITVLKKVSEKKDKKGDREWTE